MIAWLRHQTTGYDGMMIPRVRGKRREVRRMLARRSVELLEGYRLRVAVGEACPLKKSAPIREPFSFRIDILYEETGPESLPLYSHLICTEHLWRFEHLVL